MMWEILACIIFIIVACIFLVLLGWLLLIGLSFLINSIRDSIRKKNYGFLIWIIMSFLIIGLCITTLILFSLGI